MSEQRTEAGIPVVFADGVTSHFYGTNIVKFYLARFDPDPAAQGEPKTAFTVEVIMPTDGFVQMVAFFEMRLKIMIREGAITEELVRKIREATDA